MSRFPITSLLSRYSKIWSVPWCQTSGPVSKECDVIYTINYRANSLQAQVAKWTPLVMANEPQAIHKKQVSLCTNKTLLCQVIIVWFDSYPWCANPCIKRTWKLPSRTEWTLQILNRPFTSSWINGLGLLLCVCSPLSALSRPQSLWFPSCFDTF